MIINWKSTAPPALRGGKMNFPENSLILDMPVRMNECGPDEKLRAHIWFDYLQHAAAVHAEKLGFGMSAIKQKSLIWILSRIRMRLTDSPRYDDILRIETYHNGTEKIFAKRQFILSSAITGNPFGCASSFWLCLNPATMRPRPPAQALDVDLNANPERENFFPLPGKLPALKEPSAPVRHTVGASQIDLNNHMNNTCYSRYALDWVAAQVGNPVRFTEMQLHFNRAMTFGESLIVSGELSGGIFRVEGSDEATGRNSFQAEGSFRIMGKTGF